MKHVLLAGALIFAAGVASAGGLGDPVVTPAVIADAAVESAGSDEWVLALLTFLTIGLGITN